MRNNHVMVYSDQDVDLLRETIENDKGLWKTIKYLKFWSYPVEVWDFHIEQIKEDIKEFTKKWIQCYIWWWIFNSFWNHEYIKRKVKEIKKIWIETVEITNSEWNLENPVFFEEVMNILTWEFNKVLIEIWTKYSGTNFSSNYKEWEKTIYNAIKSNADDIIIEWSVWNAWIYSNIYKIKTLLLINIIKIIEDLGYKDKYIIESSIPSHQIDITQNFWEDIQLWNILPKFFKFINSIRLGKISNNELNEIKQLYIKSWLYTIFELKANNQNNSSKEANFKLIEYILDLCEQNNINPNLIIFDKDFFNLDLGVEFSSIIIKQRIEELVKEKN